MGWRAFFCEATIGDACGDDDVDEEIKTADDKSIQARYNFFELKSELHAFRDDYLANYSGGIDMIDIYYELSSDIDKLRLTLSLSIEIKDLIRDKVAPLCRELRTNPHSNNILINTNDDNEIISILNSTKSIFTNQSSLDKIDDLINMINQWKNKSNSYITNSYITNSLSI